MFQRWRVRTPCTEVYVHHHHGGFKKDTNPHRFRTFGGFCELDGSRWWFSAGSICVAVYLKGPVNWMFSTLALICTWDSGDVQKIVHLTTETCMFVMLFHALKRQVAMPFSHRFVRPLWVFTEGKSHKFLGNREPSCCSHIVSTFEPKVNCIDHHPCYLPEPALRHAWPPVNTSNFAFFHWVSLLRLSCWEKLSQTIVWQ